MNEILQRVSRQYEKNLPFVLYNKPDASQIIGLFQGDDKLHLVRDYSEIGFLFAPFNGSEIVLIPCDKSEVLCQDFSASDFTATATPTLTDRSEEESKFTALVQTAIDGINQGGFDKVVLSRKEISELTSFDLNKVIWNLFNAYPSAFAYCFYHPKIGLWLGAFAEGLLKIEGNVLHTMAVAGTQKNSNEEPVWGEKERQEQRIVTDFIVENLVNHAADVQTSAPYNLKAGSVTHIKTDITGILNKDSSLEKVLGVLHPTPAVCGLPKEAARDFILKNEGYDREYYSGFLGELNKDIQTGENNTDFYVNLRCMKIEGATDSNVAEAHLYIGCGVTKDSLPQDEWQETVNKSMTIREILR